MELYRKLYRAIKDHADLEDDTIRKAGQHGADAGWGGFTYTSDCVEFYNDNERAIWELAQEMADSMGHKSPVEMFSTFNRKDMLDDPDTFKNLLAWFALEEVGHWLDDNPHEGDDFAEEEKADEEEEETEGEEAEIE